VLLASIYSMVRLLVGVIELHRRSSGYNRKLWIEFGERSAAYPPVC